MIRRVHLLSLLIVLTVVSAACNRFRPTAATATPVTPIAEATSVPDVTSSVTTTVSPGATPSPPPSVTPGPLPSPTLVPPTSEPVATDTPPPAPTGTPTTGAPQGVDRRISFDPGATTAVVEQAVVAGTRDRYVLWAGAGQEMELSLTSLEDNASLVLAAPDGRVLAGEGQGSDVDSWQGELPLTGDYTVTVAPIRGNATYRLEITIPPITVAQPTRIAFEPGSVYAQVSGNLQAGATHRYVLRALEDQYLTATLLAPSGNAFLTVEDEAGNVYITIAERLTGWYVPALPASQDYIIGVTAAEGGASYTLEVSVSALSDQPQRIQMAPGTTSIAVEGSLAMGGDLKSYILQAAEGQTLVAEARPGDAPLNIFLRSDDGRHFFYSVENRMQVELPQDGDYVMTVSSPNAAGPIDYELEITIE